MLYEKYLELKKINNDVLYLFKSGKFYIFLGKRMLRLRKCYKIWINR